MSVSRLIFIFATLAVLAFVPPSHAGTATVSGVSRIYLRSGPGTSYAPNGFVAEGEAVTTTQQVGNWHRVQTADGRTGYIYGGYLSFAEAAPAEAAPAPPPDDEASPALPEPSAPAGERASPGELEAETPPAPAADEVDDWQEELASLKAEVARLRSEVGDVPASPGITLPTRGPVEISSTPSETSNLRTAGVAVFFLIVGWVFGAGFARRRTRSQRGRLRF